MATHIMILYVLAYLGGALTIVSPCVLPVLPFVFSRADRPFLTNGLPMLLGMASMFAIVATLAAIGGGWAVQANQVGRVVALVLLGIFGLALLVPGLSNHLSRPLVELGSRLSWEADEKGGGVSASLLLGIATGLLWAPCAGPILGIVLTGAALQGANAGTTILLFAYALGAATSLGLALLVGRPLFVAMKRSLGMGEWVRRAIGAAVLVAVVGIGFGFDRGFLTRASLSGTNSLEQRLIAGLGGSGGSSVGDLAATDEGKMPALAGATDWINSAPINAAQLKGKVVLVDFWTYSCINCLRTLPYVKEWKAKYHDKGLVVIGVHSPEFAFERDISNVRKAVRDLGITYPVAADNNFRIWQAFGNSYWPAHYFIDANGRIRGHHFGEGGYADSERLIQRLLKEAEPHESFSGLSEVKASGSQAAASADVQSPETYIGFARAERSVSMPDFKADGPFTYSARPTEMNTWGLNGSWTLTDEYASLDRAGGTIAYRFHARDLHLVLGPGAPHRSIRFRVTIDGRDLGADHGADVDANGYGIVDSQRLYQMVRLTGPVRDHTFEVEFLDPGVQAFSFTFG